MKQLHHEMEDTIMDSSPFEIDIENQADALRAFASAPSPDLRTVLDRGHDRIVLTGMGSSHFAALPTWRALTEAGHPAWWVDSGQLLDTPSLVTPETLLIATSQSGASGEIAALFDPVVSPVSPRSVVAITNDPVSPLARSADAVIALYSGTEATVSTKSYLNTLAAHQRLVAAITDRRADDVDDTANLVETFQAPDVLADLATAHAAAADARLAFIGNRDHASTALYAGLITKEAAKVAAEGFIGGQFRHGPLELAGHGLTAVLFGCYEEDENRSLRHLAAELVDAGSAVLLVGDVQVTGAHTVFLRQASHLAGLACGSVVAQHLAVQVARARGIEPGAFSFGQKITTAL